MKGNVMPSIVQIEAKELNQLVTEVKETVANDMIRNNGSAMTSFSVVDLWNIRRSVKTARAARRWDI